MGIRNWFEVLNHTVVLPFFRETGRRFLNPTLLLSQLRHWKRDRDVLSLVSLQGFLHNHKQAFLNRLRFDWNCDLPLLLSLDQILAQFRYASAEFEAFAASAGPPVAPELIEKGMNSP